MIHHRGLPLVLAAVLPGCFILTKDTLTEKEHVDNWQKTPVSERKLTYGGKATGSVVEVFAIWEQLCDFRGERVTTFDRHTGARFYAVDLCGGSGDSCLYGLFFEVLAAPITIPISGIITGITVAVSSDDTVVKTSSLPSHRGSCAVVAPNITLSVGSPGHAPAIVTTDAKGHGFVELGDVAAAEQAEVTLVP